MDNAPTANGHALRGLLRSVLINGLPAGTVSVVTGASRRMQLATTTAIDCTMRREARSCTASTKGDPIDGNLAENSIQPIALDCKNRLFAGSETVGRRAVEIMALPTSARANGH